MDRLAHHDIGTRPFTNCASFSASKRPNQCILGPATLDSCPAHGPVPLTVASGTLT